MGPLAIFTLCMAVLLGVLVQHVLNGFCATSIYPMRHKTRLWIGWAEALSLRGR